MAFQACPGIAEVEIRQRLSSEPIENVLHFVLPGESDWSAATIELLATTLLDLWSTIILPVQCTGLTLNSVLAKDLSAPVAPLFEAFPLVPVAGTLTGPAMPNQNAFVLTKRSGLTGRSARGRLYFGGFTEDQVSGNFLLDAYVDSVQTAFNELLEGIDEAGFIPVILSRESDNAPRPVGIAFNLTALGARNNRIDAQRRRMPAE